MLLLHPSNLRRLLTLALCAVLALPAAEIDANAQSPQFGLRILVVQGDGARNVIGQSPATAPVVLVEDSANRPVQDAIVVFSLPESGAGGLFADKSRSLTVTTGPDGRATMRGFVPNAVAGPFNIRVRATFLNETVTESIPQINVARPVAPVASAKKGSGRMLTILAIAGGAVAGVALAAGGGGSSPSGGSAPPPAGPIVSFGTSTVGAPR